MATEWTDGDGRPDRDETDVRLQAERKKTDAELREREATAPVGQPTTGGLAACLAHERDETNARLYAERSFSDDIIATSAQHAMAGDAVNTELEAFSYSVAHELRNPIWAILNFTAMLLEQSGAEPDDPARGYVRHIADSAREMALLVDALLELAHLTRVEICAEPADLTALAHATIARLRAAEPGRALEVVIREGMIVHGDPALLRSVLDNLVGNAWKFTRKTTQARIEVGFDDGPGGPVYYVRDNGVGFAMAHAVTMFTPFRRLHSRAEFEGTGIGLTTTQRIIERIGGRIWAEGAVGRGATFRFTLSPDDPAVVPAATHSVPKSTA